MWGSVSPIPGVVTESLDCDDVHWEHPVQEEPESGSEPSRQIPIFPVRVLAICVRIPLTRDTRLAAALPAPPAIMVAQPRAKATNRLATT